MRLNPKDTIENKAQRTWKEFNSCLQKEQHMQYWDCGHVDDIKGGHTGTIVHVIIFMIIVIVNVIRSLHLATLLLCTNLIPNEGDHVLLAGAHIKLKKGTAVSRYSLP